MAELQFYVERVENIPDVPARAKYLTPNRKAHNSQEDAQKDTDQYREFQRIMEHSKRNRKSTACRQHDNKSFATSCAAIGLASMLFSVSGVTGFSTTRTRIPHSVASEFQPPGSELNFSTLCRKDSSTRLHALLNSDEPPRHDKLRGHPVASAWRDGTAAPRLSTRHFLTRLNYRDGNEHEPQVVQRETDDLQDKEAARWWQSVFQEKTAPTGHEDEEQQVVDEYLEFLDKRYKRLHEKEKKKHEPAPKKFSALAWLTADKSPDPVSAQQEEDALYVLGVAELASERLLQKHHAALQYKRKAPALETEKEQEVVIDAVAETEPEDAVVVPKDETSEARKALMFATLATAGRKVLKGVSNRRKALIAYQEKKVVAALLAAFKTALNTPVKTTKLLWNLGGGKKTIALTASAFITAFVLIRPVAQAMMSEASLSAQ